MKRLLLYSVLLVWSAGLALAASGHTAQWWVWRATDGGSDNYGGGYDSGISGATTNYANQSAPQVVFSSGNSNLLSISSGSTTMTSAGTPFLSAHLGNTIRLTGTGACADTFWITTVTDSSNITVDHSPASTCTSVTGNLGGALATLRDLCSSGTLPSNLLATTTLLVAGNTVNVRGNGGNPDFDFSAGYWIFPSGNATYGPIKFLGVNTRPVVKFSGMFDHNASFHIIENFQFNAVTSP